MRRISTIILLVFFLLQFTKAQNKRMVSIQLSYNQAELGIEQKISDTRLFAELYAGIANQDINSNFDDFTSRLGIGYIAFSNPNNQIAIHTSLGLYFPNNDYYSITVPLVSGGARYTRFMGKKDKHGLFINADYRYGERDYKQEYSSSIINVSTIGILKISPLYISIGYGFKF